jgi:hypothetical protein
VERQKKKKKKKKKKGFFVKYGQLVTIKGNDQSDLAMCLTKIQE